MTEYFRVGELKIQDTPEILLNRDALYGTGEWQVREGCLYLSEKAQKSIPSADFLFVTTNPGKVASAQRTLGKNWHIEPIKLDIFEDHTDVEQIASNKASIAYAVLCRPVLCDDSGLVISGMNGYPGARVKPELEKYGLEHFQRLGTPPKEAYWFMTLSYMDSMLKRPLLFTSKMEGILIGEPRGEYHKEVKSPLWRIWCVKGSNKTLIEMTEEEYSRYATSDRWQRFAEFYRTQRTTLPQSP